MVDVIFLVVAVAELNAFFRRKKKKFKKSVPNEQSRTISIAPILMDPCEIIRPF